MEKFSAGENKLGIEPIGKLLLKMSLPMMISMLVLALYNVVDTYFISQLKEYSDKAINALTIAFPFQMLISGVAVGTSVGISSLVSRRLGEKNQQAADNAATTGIFLMILSGIIVSLIYFFCSKFMLKPFATKGDIIELKFGTQYLKICGSLCTFVMLGVASEKILQGTGNAVAPMITQLLGAVTNIVLDPILIFGYRSFPALGVSGAAYATVAGQIVSMIVGLLFLLCGTNKKLHISFKGFKLHGSVVRDIYDVGIPSILMQSIASFVTLSIYSIMKFCLATKELYSAAKSVIGIYFKVQSFIFMPVFGLNSGSLPIMAYNYGAHRKDRFIKTLRLSVIWALVIMCTGLAAFQFFPKQILSMFNLQDATLAMGVKAFKIISLCFPFAAIGIILIGSFNAVGKGIFALIVSACRQVVAILPAAFLLAYFIDRANESAIAIWWAYPIAEIVGLAVSLFLFTIVYKKYLNHLKPLK